jgi:hypothetical protein
VFGLLRYFLGWGQSWFWIGGVECREEERGYILFVVAGDRDSGTFRELFDMQTITGKGVLRGRGSLAHYCSWCNRSTGFSREHNLWRTYASIYREDPASSGFYRRCCQ